jgi:transposase
MPQPGRAPSSSACEPYREVIQEAAARGRNAMAIWQDLVDDHGFKGKYASVKRFMVRLRTTAPPEARVVIVTAPGAEAQVDYGEGPMVRDRESGKYKRVRLFVLTLGCSRKSVRLLAWKSSSRIWAELRVSAATLQNAAKVVPLRSLTPRIVARIVAGPFDGMLYEPCSRRRETCRS